MFCLCPKFEVPLQVGGVVFSLVVGEDVVLALDDVVEVGIPVAAVKGAVARCGEWVWCLNGGIFIFVPGCSCVAQVLGLYVGAAVKCAAARCAAVRDGGTAGGRLNW